LCLHVLISHYKFFFFVSSWLNFHITSYSFFVLLNANLTFFVSLTCFSLQFSFYKLSLFSLQVGTRKESWHATLCRGSLRQNLQLLLFWSVDKVRSF
jgi:hypothetical protein